MDVIKRDSKVQIKSKDMLDKYDRLPYKYQSKIGYDTLIQIVIPKEMISLMGTSIVEIDMELKVKISRIKFLESKLLWLLKVDEYMYIKWWIFTKCNIFIDLFI